MNMPTLEFLAELRERVRRYGWDGDYIEVGNFVESLYEEAGVEAPDLNPYDTCERCDRVTPDCTCETNIVKTLGEEGRIVP